MLIVEKLLENTSRYYERNGKLPDHLEYISGTHTFKYFFCMHNYISIFLQKWVYVLYSIPLKEPFKDAGLDFFLNGCHIVYWEEVGYIYRLSSVCSCKWENLRIPRMKEKEVS